MANHKNKDDRDYFLQTILEQKAGSLLLLLENFIYKQTTAALLLVIATVIAMTLSNLPTINPIKHIAEINLLLLVYYSR